ncbi:unnamed protein product [Bemisia tabaci]|uniref:HMG box domain-containing protein n=1 Tax=Bemisia tabaci TaxID=7038 RepID=A0A9P0G281_BEMTA|nr:unnamed protein product [Bemisia tabaci]
MHNQSILKMKRTLNTARKLNLEARILRRLKIMARPKGPRNPFAVFARLLQGRHLSEIMDLAAALVERWNQLTPEEKERLVEEISTLIRDQSQMQARLRNLAAANMNHSQRTSNSKTSITSTKRIQVPTELLPDSSSSVLDEGDVEALVSTWHYVESNMDQIARAVLLRFVKSCPSLHTAILGFKSLAERVWLNESVRITLARSSWRSESSSPCFRVRIASFIAYAR